MTGLLRLGGRGRGRPAQNGLRPTHPTPHSDAGAPVGQGVTAAGKHIARPGRPPLRPGLRGRAQGRPAGPPHVTLCAYRGHTPAGPVQTRPPPPPRRHQLPGAPPTTRPCHPPKRGPTPPLTVTDRTRPHSSIHSLPPCKPRPVCIPALLGMGAGAPLKGAASSPLVRTLASVFNALLRFLYGSLEGPFASAIEAAHSCAPSHALGSCGSDGCSPISRPAPPRRAPPRSAPSSYAADPTRHAMFARASAG
jgi:hypothetical protein